MKLLRLLLVAALLIAATQVGAASANCGVDGTMTATETSPGLWTYCVDFTYFNHSDLDSLTRLSIFLPQCDAGCRSNLVTFPIPVGTVSGLTWAGDDCSTEPAGTFYCDGDPAINAPRVPTVAWSLDNADSCNPTMPGTGQLCFMLNVAPSSPREQTNAITFLTPTGQCWGTLKGVFPGCNAPLPVQGSSWSGIKGARH